jgi:hypothetical protein
MTLEELMALADNYARATAHYMALGTPEALEDVGTTRDALAEALSLTSQFGGL